MKTLLWLGGGFLALCVLIGIYLAASAPPGGNIFASDSIVALSGKMTSGDSTRTQSITVLRKNRTYEQYITDSKSGRTYRPTGKWLLAKESPAMSMMGGNNDIVLESPVNESKVVKLGTTQGASEVNHHLSPPMMYHPPSADELNKIEQMRLKLESNGK